MPFVGKENDFAQESMYRVIISDMNETGASFTCLQTDALVESGAPPDNIRVLYSIFLKEFYVEIRFPSVINLLVLV